MNYRTRKFELQICSHPISSTWNLFDNLWIKQKLISKLKILGLSRVRRTRSVLPPLRARFSTWAPRRSSRRRRSRGRRCHPPTGLPHAFTGAHVPVHLYAHEQIVAPISATSSVVPPPRVARSWPLVALSTSLSIASFDGAQPQSYAFVTQHSASSCSSSWCAVSPPLLRVDVGDRLRDGTRIAS